MIFLCTSCEKCLCNDCRNIADEYPELLNNHKRAARLLEIDLAKANEQITHLQAKVQMYKEISEMGLRGPVLTWIQSMEIEAVVQRLRRYEETEKHLKALNVAINKGDITAAKRMLKEVLHDPSE